MATIAIGDIHGNITALDDLLNQLSTEIDDGDTVVFLGDYVDRGPHTKECIDRLIKFKSLTKAVVITLMGNHEQAMLKTRKDHSSHSWIFTNSGFTTIASYSNEADTRIRAALSTHGAEIVMERIELPYSLFFDLMPSSHHSFFDNLKLYHRTEDGIFSHGGLDPRGGPIETQPRDSLIWGTIDFAEDYHGSETLVYGHWNSAVINGQGLPEPRINNQTIGIDMSRHGFLCAVRLPDRKIYRGSRLGAGT